MTIAAIHPAYKTGINLSEDVRDRLTELLNARLADSLDLSTQAKQAHWNVKGIDFYRLHLLVFLLEKVVEHAEEYMNTIAERITALGGFAMGTATVAARFTSLPEYDLSAVTCEEHLKALSQSLAKYGDLVREAIEEADRLGDNGTVEMFTEIARIADQDLYFLEIQLDA